MCFVDFVVASADFFAAKFPPLCVAVLPEWTFVPVEAFGAAKAGEASATAPITKLHMNVFIVVPFLS